jgi:hypothetical protein
MIERKVRKHNYPSNRKKKVKHTQYMSYFRVIERWGIIPDVYCILFHDGKWWACIEDENFFDHLYYQGSYYRKVHVLEFYDGQNGDYVYGYIGHVNNGRPGLFFGLHKTRFVFVQNPMIPGKAYDHFLDISYDFNIENFKHKHIWKGV